MSARSPTPYVSRMCSVSAREYESDRLSLLGPHRPQNELGAKDAAGHLGQHRLGISDSPISAGQEATATASNSKECPAAAADETERRDSTIWVN